MNQTAFQPSGVLLDYGNTLVWYFSREEQPAVIQRAVSSLLDAFTEQGLTQQDPALLLDAFKGEAGRDHTQTAPFPAAPSRHKVFPLEARLEPFLPPDWASAFPDRLKSLCRAFMEPVFPLAHLFDDCLPFLENLRSLGIKTALVSNSPWGCPGWLWREEIARHGLSSLVDHIVLCTDIGVRKPDPLIYFHTADLLGLMPEQCLFAGDDPQWDVAGPLAAGMQAALVDRRGLAASIPASLLPEALAAGKVPVLAGLAELSTLFGLQAC